MRYNKFDPILFEGDPVDAVFVDDEEFMGQLMGTYDDSFLDDVTAIDDDNDIIIPDVICGDSIDMLDIDADEEIEAYNSIGFTDEDEDIIDKVLGI